MPHSLLILLGALLLPHSLLADDRPSPPRSRAEYCSLAKELSRFQQLALDPENLMAFRNSGGLLNGGVCWWHSRLQRNALYLALFRPDLERNRKVIKKALRALMRAERVVEIPGYHHWQELSLDWQEEIQRLLELKQIVGGFVQQAWVDGLLGRTHVPAEDLAHRMDELYAHVHDRREIVYEKLQLPGIPSHSWLVVQMERQFDGYELTVIDSNFPTPQKYTFTRGMTSFAYPFYGPFVPYLRRDGEFHDIAVEMLRFCNPKLAYQRWEPAVRQAYADSDSETRRQMELKLAQAREEGVFSDEERSSTLTEEDLTPENWAKLIP